MLFILDMDSLYRNIILYCDILRKCESPEVEKWKIEDLDRALHWADYFKKVIERTSNKRSVVEKLDVKLKEIGHQQGGDLDFTSFVRSTEHLVQTLLQNSALPQNLKEKIKERIPSSPRPVGTVQCGGSVPEPDDHKSREEELPVADAASLLLYIDQVGTTSVSSVYKKLDSLCQADGGMAIILQSVVTTTTSPASVGAQEIVVQWLLRQADIDCDKQSRLYNTRTNPLNLWQQDPASLVKVSTLHFEFFKKHIQYLVSMVNWLETLSTESKPVEELRRLSVSRAETNKPETIAHLIDAEIDTCRTRVFEKVSNHFVALLLSSSEDVKRACLSLLKSKAHCHCGREFRLSHSSSLAGCAWFRLFSEATKYIRSTLR